MDYLDTTHEFYRERASKPDPGLCCVASAPWRLPGLSVPERMLEMNYGCGSTVHSRDLVAEPDVLYVGVGGGLELLQFAYFSRRPGAVLGVDSVADMLGAARSNLRDAADSNAWFDPGFVELRRGDAMALPAADESVDVAAQNCLFNIFEARELRSAIAEMHRVLRPGGRLVLSDPIAPRELPAHLREDAELRAMCVSGALTLERYVEHLVEAGFGTIEIRARRPYRRLGRKRFGLDDAILLEAVEVAAFKQPAADDGPCVFTGKTAIYHGSEDCFDDGAGHLLQRDVPLAVCDKTAAMLLRLAPDEIDITPSSWHYDGGGCC